jgi:ergothioneine biosynthesis protein EgtB
LNRAELLESFNATRRRTRALFDLVSPDSYYARPIRLRNPIVFYEGHLPAFNVNTLLKKGLGWEGIEPYLEVIFERGIDPEEEQSATPQGNVSEWPAREEVLRYAEAADEAVRAALATAPLERDDRPALRRSEAVFAILEHELMHQETLCYMLRQLPHSRKRPPQAGRPPEPGGAAPRPESVRIPRGIAALGAEREQARFGWDNEFPAYEVEVPAFEIDLHDVTNEQFLDFVAAGGYRREELWNPSDWRWVVSARIEHPQFWTRGNGDWQWRGMFEDVPLPPGWPVYVTQAEASAYARWRGKRLPTEAEIHRAAYGSPRGAERDFPWGGEPPDSTRGNFGFERWEPTTVGSFPAGGSAWGVQDLLGNGWEWTSTVFDGFPAFEPMPSYPQYSTDFFDGQHYVLKGGSPATAESLLRRSFRNWFRPQYPYVYATFRCVAS